MQLFLSVLLMYAVVGSAAIWYRRKSAALRAEQHDNEYSQPLANKGVR